MNVILIVILIIFAMNIIKTYSFLASKPQIIDQINRYQSEITDASQKTGVAENIIKAIIYVESAGNPYAVSDVNAVGLMQVTNIAVQQLGYSYPAQIPALNILQGTEYFKWCLNHTSDLYEALRAYNCGLTKAKSNNSCGSSYANNVISKIPYFSND